MILCLGPTPCLQRTMIFDSLKPDAVNRTSTVREFASGKPTNVARVVRTLGQAPMLLTFAGGIRGKAFEADLLATRIPHQLIQVNPQTRMAITLIDRAGHTATELVEEPQSLSASNYDALLRALAENLGRATMLVISGTLPPGAKPDFYARCVEHASPSMPVIVDAVGPPLLEALVHRPLIVKPNRSELSRTLETPLDSDQATRSAMKELIADGARWVITTNGALPTQVTNGRSFWQITAPPIKPVSAIGSGDAFAAGLACAIARGEDIPRACVFAAACGAANALTPDAGHLSPVEVSRIASSIELRVD